MTCKNSPMEPRLNAGAAFPTRGMSLVSSLQQMLGRGRFVASIVLFSVLVLSIAISWATRGAMAHLPFVAKPGNGQPSIVDLHTWQIAQALSPLAVSREEVELAREAERLADHEADQAFAVALRQAGAQRSATSSEARELFQKVAQLQQTLKDDQNRLHSLTASGTAADDDLKLAQAQIDLDIDELNDAQQDLARASGDVRNRIHQELVAHQAAVAKMNAQPGDDSQMAVISTRRYGTLAGRIEAWFNQRSRHQLIEQAFEQARSDGAAFTAQHNALEASATSSGNAAAASTTAKLAALERERSRRQLLAVYDERIDTQQQLEAVYGKWASQVMLQHTIVLHMGMRSLATIVCLLMGIILCEAAGTSLLERQSLDRRRMQTLRTILRLAVQVTGAVCILLIVFGVPSQLSTALGLATAGLTVALQSFILAFFGWFILMGANGMRVGDWVEINGVAGEVTEINLFRTTLLETSDWAAKGHPTGRRATFINNFAISGQFFNFSTTGQWMWDEISVNLPATADSYEKIAQLNQAILEETRQNAEAAEQEWKRVAQPNSLCLASAASSVHMRPAGSGVDVMIRYVTRASQRVDVRNGLYEKVLDTLYKRPASVSSPQPSRLTAAVLAAGDGNDREPKAASRHSMYT